MEYRPLHDAVDFIFRHRYRHFHSASSSSGSFNRSNRPTARAPVYMAERGGPVDSRRSGLDGGRIWARGVRGRPQFTSGALRVSAQPGWAATAVRPALRICGTDRGRQRHQTAHLVRNGHPLADAARRQRTVGRCFRELDAPGPGLPLPARALVRKCPTWTASLAERIRRSALAGAYIRMLSRRLCQAIRPFVGRWESSQVTKPICIRSVARLLT